MRPKEESTFLKNDLGCKHSTHVQQFVSPFVGTQTTTKAVLLAEEKYCSIVFEKDVRCLEKSLPSFMEAYAFQLLDQA